MKRKLLLPFLWVLCMACAEQEGARTYDYPDPVDTETKPVVSQEKIRYSFGNLTFDNLFDGAHMKGVAIDSLGRYAIAIAPENEPINPSPWYAFRVVSDSAQEVTINLSYGTYEHRYPPKLSHDRVNWQELAPENGSYSEDSTSYQFSVSLQSDTLYVAGQELFTYTDLQQWLGVIGQNEICRSEIIGESIGGRNLYRLSIGQEPANGKKTLILLSRQHPPEVTGFFALQSFINTLIEEGTTNGFYNSHRVLVYPMLNPDGVDLGHWRHNLGGVDLNRDWAKYNQQEVKQIADNIADEVRRWNGEVILGLDFHSTYNDVFYTQDKADLRTPTTDWLRPNWFAKIEEAIPGYSVNESASGLGKPVSKSWFYTQFKAEGITYEIGDKTPRDSIDLIGKVTASTLMEVLLNVEDN